jgi:hypothetical protein
MTKGNGCAACGKPSETRCSGCHLVFYCSREHQVSQNHKKLQQTFYQRYPVIAMWL